MKTMPYFSHLSTLLDEVTKKFSIILCGDVNIDISPAKPNTIAKDYNNLLLSYGCMNLINRYTRICTNVNGQTSRTVIDHMSTNIDSNKVKSGVIYYEISDHLPIFGVFNLTIERLRRQTHIFRRFYDNSGKRRFLNDIEQSMQTFLNDNCNSLEDPDKVLPRLYISQLKISEDRAFPLRKLSKKVSKKFRKSWMTTGILKSMERRDKLFREQLGKNDTQLSNTYEKYRNKVNRICNAAKDLELFDSFKDIVNDPKKVWCQLNKKFLNKKHCSSALPSEIVDCDNKIHDKNGIANKLNEHFVNKGHILASKLPNAEVPILHSMKPRNSEFITNWERVLDQEIVDTIRKYILIVKSSGCDGLPAVLIKWSAQFIAPVLSLLFNKFIELGKYPNLLKMARVIALHKGGDRSKVDNYRPISVLTHINKIFEKLLHARLNDFITKHDILENNQYGFRKGHSTSHGITHLHETIIESIEKKKICVALFIDLKSAFDAINHEILIQKLDHYGIRGQALELLSSYLKDRKQFIKSDDIKSEILRVLCGVPQGSVLGPLLFIIYINDIVRTSRLGCLLFADDAVLTSCNDSLKHLEKHFNIEIQKLHRWFVANKLTLNLSKTKFILFSKKREKKAKVKKFKIKINNYNIKQVSEMKYLGVILDNKLNWHNHLQYLSTKIAKGSGIIYKLRNKVPQSVLLLLYHSLVGTYLRYGISSWGSAKTTALLKLQSLQNKVVRYITNSSPYTNVTQKYKDLGILKIDEVYFLEVAKFMFRRTNEMLPSTFDEYFSNIEHYHHTRTKSRSMYVLPKPRTDLGKQSVKFTGIKIWSEIPSIKTATSLDNFSDMLKKYLAQKSTA